MTAINKGVVLALAFEHWESFQRSREKAVLLQKWQRGEQYEADPDDASSKYHGLPYYPRRDNAGISDEYDNLAKLTPTSWADLIVRSLAQTAYIEGIRMPGQQENLEVWETFQRNRWRSKQVAVHRAAIGQGYAFGIALPGKDPITGDKRAAMTARSATEMAAWYDRDDDEWALYAMEAWEISELQTNGTLKHGWRVKWYDDDAVHDITVNGDGWDIKDWTYITYEEHPLKVTPVARCANRLDLDGRASGEIEPVLPLLRRIDQDVFDRLITQRFGAWKVRYIAGMAKPNSQEAANLQALSLRVEDLLISTDNQTKFGTLDASDPKVYSEVTDADLRMLSAITQTPPHHLLGLSSNLQAEALAAAEAGLQRKSHDFRLNAGEFHEQMARMAAAINGNTKEAAAYDMQVRWADTESRSLSQAADALGKLAVQLKVPVEMLWEKIPGWTDSDVERARDLVEGGDTIEILLQALAADQEIEKAKRAGEVAQQQNQGTGSPSGDGK